MKNNENIKELTKMAVLVALTATLTLIVRIPTPTGGNINLGDVVIFIASFLLGGLNGGFIGGVGSAIADLIGGSSNFVIATLIIKFLEGFVVGTLFYLFKNKNIIAIILSSSAGAFVMVLGYFIFEYFCFGIGTAISVLLPNIIQGLVCIILAVMLKSIITPKYLLKN